MMMTWSNEIAGANTGLRAGSFEKSRIALSPWPGVARLVTRCSRYVPITKL